MKYSALSVSLLFFVVLLGPATSEITDDIQCIEHDSICDDTKEVHWFLEAFPNGDDGHPIHVNEGDCVKFNYVAPSTRAFHDLYQFGSANDFTSCALEGVRVGPIQLGGDCTLHYPEKGTYWYGCSLGRNPGDHCAAGMKVMVKVTPAPANRNRNLLRKNNE